MHEVLGARPFGRRAIIMVKLSVGLLGLGFALSACERSPAEPAYVAEFEESFCGRSVILDADNDLWFEHGCEATSTLSRERDATAAELSAVRSAFDALPKDGEMDCLGKEPSFEPRRRLRHGDQHWRVCVSDPPGVHALTLAAFDALFNTLSHDPPSDAGTSSDATTNLGR
jgi:hypothetical protein